MKNNMEELKQQIKALEEKNKEIEQKLESMSSFKKNYPAKEVVTQETVFNGIIKAPRLKDSGTYDISKLPLGTIYKTGSTLKIK